MDRPTIGPRGRLERSLFQELTNRRQTATLIFERSVVDVSLELRAGGLDDRAVLDVIGSLVEDAQRACDTNKPSRAPGEMRWALIRGRVLRLARLTLQSRVPAPAV